MKEGKNRREWDQTALICQTVANAFSSKSIPYHRFHPYVKRQPRGIRWTPQNNETIIKAFTNSN